MSGGAESRPLTAAQQAILREALVENNRSVVHRGALFCKKAGSVLGYDELVAVGNEALALAVRNFDPARGTPFEGFAWRRILGAMKRANRRVIVDHKFEARVARAEKMRDDWAEEVEDESDLYEEKAETARHLADFAGEAAAMWIVGFVTEREQQPSALDDLVAHETRMAVNEAKSDLSPRIARLLELRYREDLEFTEIAAELGVSLATLRRDHKDVAKLLRARLEASGHGRR